MNTLRGGCSLVTLVLVAMAAIATAAEAPESAGSNLKIKNVMAEFWAFQDQVPTLERADRILRRFRDGIIEPNRDIYSKAEFRDVITDEGILNYLRELGPELPQMRIMSADLEQRTREVVAKFKQQFPRFDDRLTIVFLPTLHRFDGQYARIVEQPTVLVGLDGAVRQRGPDANFAVLLTHELFHAHHARLNGQLFREEKPPLYARIWMEGLAAYASERVNPEASLAQIIGEPSAADRSLPQVGSLADRVRVSLDSTDPAEQAKFLTYAAAAELPGRPGYWVGYEIAKALAGKYSLGELTTMRGNKLRELMRQQLEQMVADYVAQQASPALRETSPVQSSVAETLGR